MSDLGNKKVFANNLDFYMKLNNKTRKDIARDLDIPYTTISSWLKAEFYPRIDKIEQLANYFCIKKSDLVESQNTIIYKTNKKSLDLSGLSDEDIDYLKKQADYLRYKNQKSDKT